MQLKPSVNTNDHSQGNATSDLEIVEFGDFQCPHCGAAHPVIKQLMAEFGNQIKFVFRNFPLSEMHPMARPAALAAEAAGLQGKYWEMHDAIFENQRHLSENFLIELSEKLGLDTAQFKRDIRLDSLADRVDNDFESGMRSGVNGTPTFFVNGEKFNGGALDMYELIKENAG